MNPFVCEVYCDVCGEGGMATPHTAGKAWDARYSIRHSDPAVCAANLERKRERLERREAEVKAREEQAQLAGEGQ